MFPRPLLCLCCLSVLSGCSSVAGPPPSVSELGAPPPEWIDVPLAPNTWWEQTGIYQNGEYAIPVGAGEALEYKIGMAEGAMVVYDWTVEMDFPTLLNVEFHGHTERVDEAPGTVMFYTIHRNGRESGALRAPFDGIHGWYLQNQSDEDLVVRLRVAGFYTELD